MENKYPEYIMKSCRQCFGLEPTDTSRDDMFNSYTPREAFSRYCQWEGCYWPTNNMLNAIEDCFKIKLED